VWSSLRREADFGRLQGELEASKKIPLPSVDVRRFGEHQGRAFAVALTPDGRRALSAGADGTARLWDLVTGKELRQFRLVPRNHEILDVPVSPDGRRVLLGCDPIPEFDLETGKQLRLLPGHTLWVKPVKYLPDGRRVLSAGSDPRLVLWDLETGMAIRRFLGHTGPVRNLVLTSDGRRAYSCGDDKTVRLWDVESGLELGSFHGHKNQVWALALSPDGRWLVSGDHSGLVILWDAAEGREIRRETFPDRVWSAAFSPDGRFVLVGGFNFLAPWVVATGEVWYPESSGTPRQIVFFKDGRGAMTAEEDGPVRLWCVSEGAARAAHFVRAKWWEKALAEYDRLLEKSPDDVLLRLCRGRLHARRLEWAKAVDDYGRILEPPGGAAPTVAWPEIWQERGRCLAVLGVWDRAAGDYARALDLLPASERDDLSADLARWDMLLDALGRLRPGDETVGRSLVEEARKHLATLVAEKGLEAVAADLKHGPDGRPKSLLLRAEYYLQRSGQLRQDRAKRESPEVAEFVKQARSLYEQLPDNPAYAAELADFLLATRGATPKQATPLLGLARSELGGRTRLGAVLALRGEWRPALAVLQKTPAQAGEGESPHLLRGLIQTRLGETAAAWQAFAQARAVLARDKMDDSRLQTLVEFLTAALDKAPHEADLLVHRAWAQKLLGRADRAVRDTEQALALLNGRLDAGPPAAGDLRKRAQTLSARGQWDQAGADLQKYFALSKDDSPRWFQTGWWVAGPYPEDFAIPAAPERTPNPFQPLPAVEAPAPAGPRAWRAAELGVGGFLDLGDLFDKAEHISAFALTRVYSPDPRHVAVLLGSDDGVRLWLNGRLVFETAEGRMVSPGEEAVSVTLRAGWNTLLARVSNGVREHALHLRLSDDPHDRTRALAEAARWDRSDEPAVREVMDRQPGQPLPLFVAASYYRRRTEELLRTAGGRPSAEARARKAGAGPLRQVDGPAAGKRLLRRRTGRFSSHQVPDRARPGNRLAGADTGRVEVGRGRHPEPVARRLGFGRR
jgi:WD40 repeat protein/tetratricopeptide (TPR) repeat protein